MLLRGPLRRFTQFRTNNRFQLSLELPYWSVTIFTLVPADGVRPAERIQEAEQFDFPIDAAHLCGQRTQCFAGLNRNHANAQGLEGRTLGLVKNTEALADRIGDPLKITARRRRGCQQTINLPAGADHRHVELPAVGTGAAFCSRVAIDGERADGLRFQSGHPAAGQIVGQGRALGHRCAIETDRDVVGPDGGDRLC